MLSVEYIETVYKLAEGVFFFGELIEMAITIQSPNIREH